MRLDPPHPALETFCRCPAGGVVPPLRAGWALGTASAGTYPPQVLARPAMDPRPSPPRPARLVLWASVAAVCALSSYGARAQGGVVTGAEAYERGDYETAEVLLLRALGEDSLAVGGRPARSAGYWLGAVYEARGDSARARETWLAGLRRRARRGVLDVPAADAFVRSVFAGREGASYVAAETAYLHLLRAWSPALGDDDREVVEGHVAQALLVVPRADRPALDGRADMGTALAARWAAEDPLPASALNERVVEHLERVADARRRYPGRGPTGLDDRGDVYVRLGAPTRSRSIDFYTPELVRRVQELRRSTGNDLLVEPSDFADNEVWVYEGAGVEGDTYSFLFVGEGRDYRVGQTVDLIPSRLRVGFDRNTGRGGAKADIVMEALRTIYRQLSTESMSFGERYGDVEGYLSEMEMLRSRTASKNRARSFGRQGDNITSRSDYSAAAQASGTGDPSGGRPPDLAVRSALETARREDEVIRAQREAGLPAQRSRVLDRIEPFPVSVRFSRFLDADGATRLDVDWAALPGALALGADARAAVRALGLGDHHDAVVRASLVRRPGGAGRRVEHVEFVSVLEADAGYPEASRAYTVATREEGGALDVAVQWDQYVARLLPDSIALGPRARVAVVRVEAPAPLRADGLEVSDLRPLRTADREPYPYDRVVAGEPVSVYFEVYGLEPFGGRFTVEYEVTQRQRGSIFRRDREETSGGRLVSRVQDGRAEEYLILDTSRWAEADEVDVTVRVTAGPSGRVERTVRFEVAETLATAAR